MSRLLLARIGPRNRRRLTIAAGIGAAAVIAVVAAVLLTRPTTSGHAVSTSRSTCVGGAGNGGVDCGPSHALGIVFGMTPQQVQSRIGKPVATQGRCWLYPQPVDKYLAAYGVVKSVLDVCFLGGRLSDTEGQSYIRRNGKLVIFKPPPPKLP